MKALNQKKKKVKKQENKPKIIIKYVPRTKEEEEEAIKRLTHIFAMALGWVPKELTRTKSFKQKPHQT